MFENVDRWPSAQVSLKVGPIVSPTCNDLFHSLPCSLTVTMLEQRDLKPEEPKPSINPTTPPEKGNTSQSDEINKSTF